MVEHHALEAGQGQKRLPVVADANRRRRALLPQGPAGRQGPCALRTPAGLPAQQRPHPWGGTGRTSGTSRPRRSCRRGCLVWPAGLRLRLRLRLLVRWVHRRGKTAHWEPLLTDLQVTAGRLWRSPRRAAGAGCSACTARLCAAWGPPPCPSPADQPAHLQSIPYGSGMA